ncbi:unnamed protein product [Rotaria socialis]|uniref:RING-type domain-containing protein n=1 Tax=Rotaria socialis TaxID=392032 RepID=A0A818P7E4_9BILA|nr:unnamed protein product [Rotaria socialis]CAF4697605.1 unnamed protein product [Rotaria socialis]
MATTNNYRTEPFTFNGKQSCPWRVIRNGLNIEGLCKNSSCQAYDKMVIINLGFGEFDFARIVLQRPNKCPICNSKIVPFKYALNNCRWWYVNHYSTNSFALNTVTDAYELNNLECEYKILETMPLLSRNEIYTISQETACPICLIDIKNDDESIFLPCAHSFHRACICEWLASNQIMSHTCPLCREHIVEN